MKKNNLNQQNIKILKLGEKKENININIGEMKLKYL